MRSRSARRPYRAHGELSDSLTPVLRGEGWGEGSSLVRCWMFDVECSMFRPTKTSNTQHRPLTRGPLSPALSPEYRGEGARGRGIKKEVVRCCALSPSWSRHCPCAFLHAPPPPRSPTSNPSS